MTGHAPTATVTDPSDVAIFLADADSGTAGIHTLADLRFGDGSVVALLVRGEPIAVANVDGWFG